MQPRKKLGPLVRGVAVVAAALPLAQSAYAATLRLVVGFAVRRLREGDSRPLLALYARDVHFVFSRSELVECGPAHA